MNSIDLNADLGEGCPNDSLIIPLISSANISCGAHAGNEHTIRLTIEKALANNIAIGAHPGYQDPENFGRKPLHLSDNDLHTSIKNQLTYFLNIATQLGATIHHVKPHGALYNQANQHINIATILTQTIAQLLPKTKIYCPHTGQLSIAASQCGLHPIPEAFADRRYLADSTLVPRHHPSAIIHNIPEATQQALLIAKKQPLITTSRTTIPIKAQTICIHGDNPQALQLIHSIRNSFHLNNISIRKP